MAQAKLNHQPIYNLKLLKAAAILAVCFVFQLFFSYSAFAAAPTASISTNKDNVGITITPSAEGSLGTNPEPATISYDTTCKVSGTKATIYISTSPRTDTASDDAAVKNGTALLGTGITGVATGEVYTIPVTSTTTTDLTTTSVATALVKDTWGFNLTGDDKYFGFPNTSDPKIKLDILDNNAPTRNDSGTTVVYGNKTVYYNANVSTATPPGDYSTTVTYTIVLDDTCNGYIVNYDGNGADAGTSTASSTLYWSDKDDQTLASNNFTKDGYLFQGWALDKDAEEPDFCVSETDACPNGKQSYSDDKINGKGEAEVTVYAVWRKKYYMQDEETYAACMALDYGKTMKAYDNRDENDYLIGRLKDGTEKGKCWMLQNLRLDLSDVTLTEDNSHVSSTINWATAPNRSISSTYTAPHYYSPTGTAKKYTGPATGKVADNTTYWTDITNSDDTAVDPDIGLLYNYCAASAGEVCTAGDNSTEATQDICPKGWRLPTGGAVDTSTMPNKGELQTLYNAYGSAAAFDNAYKPVLAGYFNSSLVGVGSNGYYWSSSASSTSGRYRLYVNTTGVNTASGGNRNYGFSVRCVAQRPLRTDLSLTISFDETMVEKVEVKKDSAEGDTVATISTGGGSTGGILIERQAYYLVPTYQDGYKFSSWTNGTRAAGTLSDPSDPTPAYTIGDGTNLVILTARQNLLNCTNSATCMQKMSFSDCPATTTGGTVYDGRNGAGYKVKKITLNGIPTCWMMTNLKLPAGTKLTSADSNITETDYAPNGFTLPTESWSSSSQDYYCKPIMAVETNGEYYYNWYAATANPTSCSNPTSSDNATEENDSKSLGDICPKGWRLPVYSEEIAIPTWRASVLDYGSLAATGYFRSGEYHSDGYGYWWSSSRNGDSYGYHLYYLQRDNTTGTFSNLGKQHGFSVRCVAQTPPRTDLSLTVSFDGSMVEKVEVKKDSAGGETVATISTSGGSTGNILTEYQAYYLVPTYKDGYGFFSWANGAGAAGTLSDPSNPTPAYTIGDDTNSVTLTACLNTITTTTTMQNFNPSSTEHCVGAKGTLTDSRNNVSYGVVKINDTDYWMRGNLRLAAGTVLNSSTSNVSGTFTLPDEEWKSSSQNYYCKPIMAVSGGEYYYNWYAATANPTECDNPTSETNATVANDSKSLGDICPKGWNLPSGAEVYHNSTWLTAVEKYGNLNYTGLFYSGSTYKVGSSAAWWSSTRNYDYSAYFLKYEDIWAAGERASGNYYSKYYGHSVRCMRRS